MKLGFAKKEITVPFPVALAGYGHSRIAHEQLDNIYIKIVVMEHEKQTYGILSYDLCAIDASFITRVKQEMERLQLEPSNFLFSATHTHSALAGMIETRSGICEVAKDVFGPTNEVYRDLLMSLSIEGLRDAIVDKKEGTICVAKDTLSQIGKNRNEPSLQGNDSIWVAYAKQIAGEEVTLMNFACHPTILSYSNTFLSADFPGAIDSMMMQQGYKMNIFLNGSCGDISTRFTRLGSGVKEVNRMGGIAMQKLCEMKQYAKEVQLDFIRVYTYTISCKLKPKDSLAHAQAEVQKQKEAYELAKQARVSGSKLRLQESFIEGAEANLRHAMYGLDEKQYPVKISIWKICHDYFICIPGELFSELSNEMDADTIHFINYANGYLGYFANQAYNRQYYEALSSPFMKGEGERLMNHIKELLRQLEGKIV